MPAIQSPAETSQPWAVTEAKVREAVDRVVASCHPRAVVLFGSWARGDAEPGSDCDMLVVADDSTENCRRESVKLRRALRGISMPVDILVVRQRDLDRLKFHPGLVYAQAIREGIVAHGHL